MRPLLRCTDTSSEKAGKLRQVLRDLPSRAHSSRVLVSLSCHFRWKCHSPAAFFLHSSSPYLPPQIDTSPSSYPPPPPSRCSPSSSSSPPCEGFSSSPFRERECPELSRPFSGLSPCSRARAAVPSSRVEANAPGSKGRRSARHSAGGKLPYPREREDGEEGLMCPAPEARSSVLEGPGRVLQIPLVECFFSFICSANNNIPRLVRALRLLFRSLVGSIRW